MTMSYPEREKKKGGKGKRVNHQEVCVLGPQFVARISGKSDIKRRWFSFMNFSRASRRHLR